MLNRAASIIIMFGLAGFGRGTSAAETSMGLLGRDPQQQYYKVKNVLLRQLEQHHFFDDSSNPLTLPVDGGFDDYAPSLQERQRGRIAQNVLDLALYSAFYEGLLRHAGFPESAWRSSLDQFERRGLASGQFDAVSEANELKRNLNTYRKSAPGGSRLPTIALEEGTGAGGVEVPFLPQKQGTQIWIIPQFNYQLCKAQGIDADDIVVCGDWKQVSDGRKHKVSGFYYVRILGDPSRKSLIPWSASEDEGGRPVTF
jgi:hypothetical protein